MTQASPLQHRASAPSPWVVRWSHLVARGANVLDVACGSGRHLQWFLDRGHPVTGVDIQVDAASSAAPDATLVCADIETGPWPLVQHGAVQQFEAVIVTNYLWRPLLGTIIQSVAPGGVLVYETFAQGNETVGRPSRADFLLGPGELLAACSDLHVVAYENGTLKDPQRFVQRIAATRPLNAPHLPGWNTHHAL